MQAVQRLQLILNLFRPHRSAKKGDDNKKIKIGVYTKKMQKRQKGVDCKENTAG
jgi:hypothetical protein